MPDSRKLFDGCGVCLHPSRDYKVWNDTCRGCDGVPNSGKVYDVCCKCDGGSTVEDKCYQDMFAGSFDRDLFTHNKGLFLREYAAQAEYLVPKWLEKYDKCGDGGQQRVREQESRVPTREHRGAAQQPWM